MALLSSSERKTMTILQIEYFVEIAKSGSFSKAAEKLFVTHQALILQMQALEKELGFPLFDRSNKRKLKLLESGEILYQTWAPFLETHWKAVLEAKSHYEGQMKTLRIGVQDAPKVREATISFISDCQNTGNMKPEFIVGYPGPLLASLEKGELDLCSVISLSLLGKEQIQCREIGKRRAKMVIAVCKDHPLAKKKKLTIHDIKDETILIFDENYSNSAKIQIEKQLQEAGIEHYTLQTKKNIQEVKMAVCLNQGVTIDLDEVMADVLDKVKLFPLPSKGHENEAKIVLVWKDPKWKDILL